MGHPLYRYAVVLRFDADKSRNCGKIQGRWLNLKLCPSSVSAERIRLGFTWRPLLVKQELSVAQEHQRIQFVLHIRHAALDSASIVFSDESRFFFGDDRR
jgi:hypothetical protein